MVPFDTEKPFVTSGVRIGVPAVTTRGFGPDDCRQTVEWIDRILQSPEDETLISNIRSEINEYMGNFPLYPELG